MALLSKTLRTLRSLGKHRMMSASRSLRMGVLGDDWRQAALARRWTVVPLTSPQHAIRFASDWDVLLALRPTENVQEALRLMDRCRLDKLVVVDQALSVEFVPPRLLEESRCYWVDLGQSTWTDQVAFFAGSRSTHVFVAQVCGVCQPRPLLASAIRRLARWSPGFTRATGPDFRGPIRTVGDLAASMSCSRRYLQREAKLSGLCLGRTIRWSVVLHGLACYLPARRNWTTVSAHLGFGSASGWTHFCARVSGSPPSELSRLPTPIVLARALDGVCR